MPMTHRQEAYRISFDVFREEHWPVGYCKVVMIYNDEDITKEYSSKVGSLENYYGDMRYFDFEY